MAFKMEIEGLDEAIRAVERLASTLDPEEVEDVLMEGADIITEEARGNAPEGEKKKLKKAIKSKRGKRQGRLVANAYSAVDWLIAPHAYLVEYGHGGDNPAPAHPYFRPAVDTKMGEAQQVVEEGLKKLIEGGVD